MAFIKKQFSAGDERIQPAIPTDAMAVLEDFLSKQFRAAPSSQKPTAITCFDTSGSGKTATVEETARRVGASIIVVSPNFSPALKQVLKSCSRYSFKAVDGLVQRHQVKQVFEEKFDSALVDMFGNMRSLLEKSSENERIDKRVNEGEYHSPPSSLDDVNATTKESAAAFEGMREALGKRNLVIHIDDCQLFFMGVVPSYNNDPSTIQASEVMAIALSSFSSCITTYASLENIAWIFSGTRPNLLPEVTLTSGLDAIDLSGLMTDFRQENIRTVFNNFFCLQSATSEQSSTLSDCFSRLEGPPKNLLFFLKAAATHHLNSIQQLIEQWSEIEIKAVNMFEAKIVSTFRGDLYATARQLAIVHATSLMSSGSDFILVTNISRHFIFLIEAGLLRVHRFGKIWKLFAPNRFLVLVFQKFVRWYTFENISMLRNCISTSSGVLTLNGKSFEYCFALELCNSASGKLLSFLTRKVGLMPLDDSSAPSICHTACIEDCVDTNRIYVMQDLDRSDSKCDVVFFAKESATEKCTRVLVQLTLAACTASKINDSFNGMLLLPRLVIDGNELQDSRVFFGPNCYITLKPAESFYQQNHIANECHTFIGQPDAFEFDINVICTSRSTDVAIAQLTKKAEASGNLKFANQLALDFDQFAISNKRPRTLSAGHADAFAFADMDGFYEALEGILQTNKKPEQLKLIRRVFDEQDIESTTLPRLTDEKLKEYGVEKGGIREAILAVLGK